MCNVSVRRDFYFWLTVISVRVLYAWLYTPDVWLKRGSLMRYESLRTHVRMRLIRDMFMPY